MFKFSLLYVSKTSSKFKLTRAKKVESICFTVFDEDLQIDIN